MSLEDLYSEYQGNPVIYFGGAPFPKKVSADSVGSLKRINKVLEEVLKGMNETAAMEYQKRAMAEHERTAQAAKEDWRKAKVTALKKQVEDVQRQISDLEKQAPKEPLKEIHRVVIARHGMDAPLVYSLTQEQINKLADVANDFENDNIDKMAPPEVVSKSFGLHLLNERGIV